MFIFSYIVKMLTKLASMMMSKEALKLIEMQKIFGNECALCDDIVEHPKYIELDDKKVPVCIYCKARIENGANWTSLLKANYLKNNRKYCNKYLRVILWVSEY